MDFSFHQQNDVTRVKLSGQVTFADTQKFKHVLELLERDGLRGMELDFAGVTFIDSAGLGMLLLLRDVCQSRHVQVSIHGAQGQVQKVFLISKFDQLFSIHP